MLEMGLYLAILGGVLAVADQAMAAVMRLQRLPAPAESGAVLDLACAQLRRDLRFGGAMRGRELMAGAAHWRDDDGWLSRDGRHRVARCRLKWTTLADGIAAVHVVPPSGPERVIEVGRERRP
jgi:hypothetical protein